MVSQGEFYTTFWPFMLFFLPAFFFLAFKATFGSLSPSGLLILAIGVDLSHSALCSGVTSQFLAHTRFASLPVYIPLPAHPLPVNRLT